VTHISARPRKRSVYGFAGLVLKYGRYEGIAIVAKKRPVTPWWFLRVRSALRPTPPRSDGFYAEPGPRSAEPGAGRAEHVGEGWQP
jgi:hypothetical protein